MASSHAPRLREQNGRQRVHEREVATIAGRVQRGRGLCQVLADDAGIADLLVAECQLVMREADGARSCASSACLSARVCSAIARDCSPRANAMRP